MLENKPDNTKEDDEGKKDSPHHVIEENSVQGKDLKKRSYYYDDSYGYEIYQPDEAEKREASE